MSRVASGLAEAALLICELCLESLLALQKCPPHLWHIRFVLLTPFVSSEVETPARGISTSLDANGDGFGILAKKA
jgi:hypothetical protein